MPLLFASRLLGDDANAATPPPAPTLSVTDNGNGTGATATISGSSTGSTNTVSVILPQSKAGTLAAVATGTRVGDGTVSLSLPSGWYVASVSSVLNGLASAPATDYSFSASGATGSVADYGQILASVIIALKADANLTGASGLLAPFDPNGIAPARTNSIFYQRPPVAKPPTPCIVLADLHIDPAAPIAEEPTHYASVPLVVYVFGSSDKLRPIMWQIDEALKPTACASGAMDTSDWKIVNIDSGQRERRGWMTVPVDEQLTDNNGVLVEQRAKVFVVRAASTHN